MREIYHDQKEEGEMRHDRCQTINTYNTNKHPRRKERRAVQNRNYYKTNNTPESLTKHIEDIMSCGACKASASASACSGSINDPAGLRTSPFNAVLVRVGSYRPSPTRGAILSVILVRSQLLYLLFEVMNLGLEFPKLLLPHLASGCDLILHEPNHSRRVFVVGVQREGGRVGIVELVREWRASRRDG